MDGDKLSPRTSFLFVEIFFFTFTLKAENGKLSKFIHRVWKQFLQSSEFFTIKPAQTGGIERIRGKKVTKFLFSVWLRNSLWSNRSKFWSLPHYPHPFPSGIMNVCPIKEDRCKFFFYKMMILLYILYQ